MEEDEKQDIPSFLSLYFIVILRSFTLSRLWILNERAFLIVELAKDAHDSIVLELAATLSLPLCLG